MVAVLLCGVAAAQGVAVYSTKVGPLEGEDLAAPCQYELSLPQRDAAVGAVFVIFGGGREVVDFYNDPDLFRFATDEHLALLLARHCGGTTGELNTDPSKGAARALTAALDQLAQQSRHGELQTVKLMLFGFDDSGALAARFPIAAPDRTLGVIAYAAPLRGLDLTPAAAHIPQLIIANAADAVNPPAGALDYFQRHFAKGAPWAFAIQNGVAQDGGLANTKPLQFAWMQSILDALPGPAAAIALASAERRGYWLYLRMEGSAVGDARTEKAGSRSPGEYTPAGWVPDKKAANEWRDFVKKSKHPVDSKYP